MQTFTLEQVSKHNKTEDCWIVVDGKVFDVTKFASEHPGGKKVLLNVGGTDATSKFDQFHQRSVLEQYKRLQIGVIGSATTQEEESKPDERAYLPYSDPMYPKAFYNASHLKFRNAVRAFVKKELDPFVFQWDENKQIPRDVIKKCADAGILPGIVSFWPTEYTDKKPAGNIKPEEFNMFHTLILIDELSRTASASIGWFVIGSLAIAIPPIIKFGSQYIRDKVVRKCLNGEAIISLCITEPSGGSDVANIKTTATKTADGKHFIVNGEKKWITNGVNADFFTVAVRTGGKGMSGVSLLLLERGMPGLTTKPMLCTGAWSSGTTYITMEDVKVPVENLIGKENEGFKVIMYNFNHERWGLVIQALSVARVAYEEAFKYAHKRRTFGKLLIEQGVIAEKLGTMARLIESAWAWLDVLTYQMTQMSHEEAAIKLGGSMALIKVHATKVLAQVSMEAANVFGGLSYSRGGQAEKVERITREVRAYVIGGGTEEVLQDLGVRLASRYYMSKM